jgi:membrane protein YdbS with pleckstrin-like domain
MTNKDNNKKNEVMDNTSKKILEIWMSIPRSIRILVFWVIIFIIALIGWARLLIDLKIKFFPH